jgi:N-methylhydantoinase A
VVLTLGRQRGYLLKSDKVIVGVDTGGTFTDFIYKDGNSWKVLKLLSTPENPAKAVLEGLRIIAEGRRKDITHGSTVATNAVLERKGAKTGFITNKGFEDIAYIGRQNRKELYNLHYRRKPPLYKSAYGLNCRVIKNGEIIKDLNIEELKGLIENLKADGIQSVAVCFLFSFINPEHENTVGEYLEKEGFDVSLSHQIVSEFREYERASTTIVNAYVMPKMKGYITYLEENLDNEDKLRVMQSNGGVISTDTVKKEPVRTILSGPAGGVVGALKIGKLSGFDRLITFDMGGTSTDVSLIDGKLSISTESEIEDFPIKVPMIDIHTVGAGGGSIAYIDKGGALNVGPESAGADPGPICYGKGDKITITDANLFLGRLIPEYFLGGKMRLYPERLKPYFEYMASKLGITPIELAEGILEIGNIKMEKALRAISIERGYNPSDFTLFSFGGAGGLHAVFLARMLGIPQVLVPQNPGILSAMGMLLADIIKDYSLTVMQSEKTANYQALLELFKFLEGRAKEELKAEGIENIHIERYIDARYKGQSFELMIPFDKDFVEKFHLEHKKVYGYENRNREVEIVNIRVRAIGEREKPVIEKAKEITDKIPEDALLDVRNVIFDGKVFKTNIFDRERLKAGNRIEGSAIIVEYSSTTVIPPFAEMYINEYKHMIIKIKS